MKHWSNILIVSIILTFCAACANDDDDGYRYPDLRTELVEAATNGETLVSTIRLDDGSEYVPTNTIETTTADTIFRCICSYEDNGDGTIGVYSLQRIPSGFPQPADKFEGIENAPLKVLSRWESGRYINAYLSYKTSGRGNHTFQFCEDGITSEEGIQTAKVRLIHKAPPEDAASYTSYIYISFPKYYYDGKADAVQLTIE